MIVLIRLLFVVCFSGSLMGCAKPHLVKDKIPENINTEEILADVVNFSIFESNGNKYIANIVKSSKFYPEFNDYHIIFTDLNGNISEKNQISHEAINNALNDKVGNFIGNAVVNAIFTAATGVYVGLKTDEELYNIFVSDDTKYVSISKIKGFNSNDILVFEKSTGLILAKIGRNKDSDSGEVLSGYSRNTHLGFLGDYYYALSTDFSKSENNGTEYHVTIINLLNGELHEIKLPNYVQTWFDVYKNFTGSVAGVTKGGELVIYDVVKDELITKITLSDENFANHKCFQRSRDFHPGPFANIETKVTINKDTLFVNRNSDIFYCKNVKVKSLNIKSDSEVDVFEIDTVPFSRLNDFDDTYSSFGVLSEYIAPKTFSGIIDYKSKKIVPIYEGSTIYQDETINSDGKIYYYFTARPGGLFRVDISDYVQIR